jgi:hypothetical protein
MGSFREGFEQRFLAHLALAPGLGPPCACGSAGTASRLPRRPIDGRF